MKNTIIKSILDVLAPNYCLSCGRVGEILCGRCKKDKLDLLGEEIDGVWFLGKREGILKDLIYLFKFEGNKDAGEVLARLCAENLPPDLPENMVVVPLPTIDKHIRARGLDHTSVIAKTIAEMRGWGYEELLGRRRDTVQVGADESVRKKQAQEAYKVRLDKKIDPTLPYLLIDDVWTTGSSILAGQKVLKEAGVKKIDLAVLAKSQY